MYVYCFSIGGRIDQAHHKNRANQALIETVEFDEAIELAVKETSEEDTLIIVTADHSHPMTINGYAKRGNNITGVAEKDDFDLMFPTLMYTNGPGYINSTDRRNLTNEESG